MAKLAKGTTTNPRKACKDESKKHVAGEHGTPFSRCVSSRRQAAQGPAQRELARRDLEREPGDPARLGTAAGRDAYEKAPLPAGPSPRVGVG